MTKLSTPRKRGRPKKHKPRFFTEDASREYVEELSAKISDELKIPKDDLTKSLAITAISCGVMEQVRYQAPLKREGKGNRPNIHLAALLADCAKLHEHRTGENATSALAKIGGWAEEANEVHPVLSHAVAVLSVLDIKHASLRRQARRAMEILE